MSISKLRMEAKVYDGRTCIPKPIREIMGIEGGDVVEYVVTEDWDVLVVPEGGGGGYDKRINSSSKLQNNGYVWFPDIVKDVIGDGDVDKVVFDLTDEWDVMIRGCDDVIGHNDSVSQSVSD